ncbi:hypothetical protein [Arthrobacter bambusae]|uniref:hypothetical protein n=1 Tax=Arthrobacter bambusae TaxID=1338426 RepID=UPI0027830048|nr:hypothetical protein [Arthrobacter bambusae]MDQ0031080.1 hypothetical protein [Arthrobacter bambusae]MDQ0098787.1 hypothetical protein [Arthrobacter bambusae]
MIEDTTDAGQTTGPGPEVAIVDAGAMQDLTEKYTEYRRNLAKAFFDPVHALTLTGEVLASVREIVINQHHRHP